MYSEHPVTHRILKQAPANNKFLRYHVLSNMAFSMVRNDEKQISQTNS
jgi:hypothetical protein